nr:alpha/beta hydrolase [Microbacterium hydrocarbonoxydans]
MMLTVRGMQFRAIESGARDAADTIVLIHGIGMSHRYLARLHRALAPSARVVSLDLPGFGGLAKPPRTVTIEEMAECLAEVLSAITDDRVVLVGHSMGAQWAVETATRHPARVAGVIAIGPVVDDARRTLSAQALALARDTLGETPATNFIVFTDYLRCGPRWYLRQAAHMLSYRIEDAVRSLRVPLLVMRGAKDPVAGAAWCARLAARGREVGLITIPGRHHVVQRSAPEEVATAIREWGDRLRA